MGYFRHHAIIVTGYDSQNPAVYPSVAEAHKQAVELFDEGQVTPVVAAPVNGWHSFVVLPDGSKEGWDESVRGDAARDAFVAWLDAHRFADGSSPFFWVEVQYGDDNRETTVVRHSDQPSRWAIKRAVSG